MLPAKNGIRGIFFNSMKAQLAAKNFDPVDVQRRIPFKSYSRGDYLDLVIETAKRLRPDDLGHGIFDVGAAIYPALRQTLIGKSIFSVAGLDYQRALQLCPRAYAASNVLGEVTVEDLSESHIHVVFKDVWNFVHLNVGTFVGGMEVFNVEPVKVEFLEHQPGHMELKLEWKKKDAKPSGEL